MINNFDACCDFTLRQEGGFCNVAGDPGGATNHGITMATLSQYLGRPATVADVQNMTTETAEAIYKPDYWDAVHGDELPAGVNLVTWDFGVNASPRRSIERLQGLLKLNQDGVMGPLTLGSVRAHDAKWLITMLSYSHRTYYKQLDEQEFEAGWIARVDRCQAAALQMLVNSIMPAVAIS